MDQANKKPVKAFAFMASEYDCGHHYFGIASNAVTVEFDDGSEETIAGPGMVYGRNRGQAKWNFWNEYKEWSKSNFGRSIYLSPKIRKGGSVIASF